MKDERIKILYIAGAGRSGSTLLERMVGSIDEFVSVGELRLIWERGILGNELCGCGSPFWECDFWRTVMEQAFGAVEAEDFRSVPELKQKVARTRFIPRLLWPWLRTQQFSGNFQAYANLLGNLYRTIYRISEGKILIDSSKDPSYALLLHVMGGVDLYIVHLVRDSRAVVNSWQRKKVRPEVHWKKEFMPVRSIISASVEWNLRNSLLQLLGHLAPHYTRLRYEELTNNPKAALDKIIRFMGLEQCNLPSIQGNDIELRINHTVAGNPMRFRQGPVTVKNDDKWISEMHVAKRILVSVITWPLLLLYGYPVFKRKIVQHVNENQ